MPTFYPSQTIVAIATPPGIGGVAIVRLSGVDSLSFAQQLFIHGKISQEKVSFTKDRPLFSFKPRYMHYGFILDKTGEVLDEVLAVYMPGPASVTGEDVIEVHCHGGQAISAAVLEGFLSLGARLAEPGEFTKRSFLNNRIDLTQAEAVIEAIHAPSREGARLAEAKLRGMLASKITTLRSSLDSLRIQMTVAVDFPEDEPEILPQEAVLNVVREAKKETTTLVQAYERASLWREGAVVVLAGQVNAGKSSLLNALLGRERSIVSSLAGTTRDYIEESINIKGMALRLIDTAGLRQGGDIVEEEGIRRSYHLADDANLLLLVIDSEQLQKNKGKLSSVEQEFLERYAEQCQNGQVLLVLNKSDVIDNTTLSDLEFSSVSVSALEGKGLDDLSNAIFEMLCSSSQQVEGDIAPNKRQSILLLEANKELLLLETDILACLPADILAVRVDHVVSLLDEVTGTTSDEAILNEIFSSFCIGK